MDKNLPHIKYSTTQEFHDKTKTRDFVGNKHKPGEWPREWTEIHYKTYPRFNKIKLAPIIKDLPSLDKCLIKRSSIRDFSNESLSQNVFSSLLFYSFGQRKEKNNRFYPSAGARYPIEVYPVILNINNLNKGIYHYNVISHSLEYLWTGKNFESNIFSCFDQPWIKHAALLLLFTSVFWRSEMKYSLRGYRFVMIDAGHMSQNAYLVSTSLKLGCCAIGGFLDDKINNLLDIDGIEESTIMVLAIGKRQIFERR
ncbi:MAG: SagB/ThcOx family dehydrogenase [Patescibacteria group bacterium]|nr:SagB/ThcOx family dehydrogenase [Patescibacteria group bacterium]MCL5095656.1 SagB/ThcOx family dehydrogenase [Patescibacteria group bacterium]